MFRAAAAKPALSRRASLVESSTESAISSDGVGWRAKLLHADGNYTQIGPVCAGLQEAQVMCEMAWKYEHAHDCTANCKDWELF
jgi:hypothetical protein